MLTVPLVSATGTLRSFDQNHKLFAFATKPITKFMRIKKKLNVGYGNEGASLGYILSFYTHIKHYEAQWFPIC